MKRLIVLALATLCFSFVANAQIGNLIRNKVNQKVEEGVNKAVDKAVDNAIDKTFENTQKAIERIGTIIRRLLAMIRTTMVDGLVLPAEQLATLVISARNVQPRSLEHHHRKPTLLTKAVGLAQPADMLATKANSATSVEQRNLTQLQPMILGLVHNVDTRAIRVNSAMNVEQNAPMVQMPI